MRTDTILRLTSIALVLVIMTFMYFEEDTVDVPLNLERTVIKTIETRGDTVLTTTVETTEYYTIEVEGKTILDSIKYYWIDTIE